MKEACAVDIKWQHWRTPWQLIRTSASPSNNTNHIERAEWKLLLNFPHPINCCRHNTRWISCRAWWTADKQLRKRRNSIDRRTFLLLLLQRIPVAVSAGVSAAAGVCTEGKGGGTSIDMVVAENEKNARWWWLAEKSYTFLCRTLIQKKRTFGKKPCQNSTSGTCVCGNMRHFCSIDTSRPYSSDSGRVAFSPELRVGTGSDNFFTFRT